MNLIVTVTDADTGAIILRRNAASAIDGVMQALIRAHENGVYNPVAPRLKAPPIHILGVSWPISIYPSLMRIGCEIHAPAAWATFGPAGFLKMSATSFDDWQVWGDWLLEGARRQAARAGG